jgi:multiple antibiotic resistance protein
MPDFLQFTLLAVSAVFVIVDPIGVVPLFLALTPHDSPSKKWEMARRACVVAWSVLVVFAVAGTRVLAIFGITLAAFKVAGGLLMLVTAYDQLRASPVRTRTSEEEQSEGAAKEDISIVPLAMPLLAGPGAIATVMVLMSKARGAWQSVTVVMAVTVTMIAAFVGMTASERLARLLGATGRQVMERLIGLVLAAIAVQFVLDGALEAVGR